MSTFLQLVQDLHRECGVSGPVPQSVANQTGEYRRLVNWIKSADLYIQNQWFNWKFLWANPGFNQPCVAANPALSAPIDLGMWDLDTFRITQVGSSFADPLAAFEYEDVKMEILDTSQDVPSRVIVMPDNSLKFEAVPNAAHIVTADYFKNPTELAINTDISSSVGFLK